MTKKRVPVTVVFHLEAEVPEDWDADQIEFHVEENTCRDNFVEAMHRQIAAGPDVCHTCTRSEAIVGHVPFEAIRAAGKGE